MRSAHGYPLPSLSLGGGRSRSTRNSIGRARRLPISPPRSDNDAKSGGKGAVEGHTSTRARVRDHLGSGTEAFPGDSPHTTPRKVDRRGQCQNTAQLDPARCTAAALRTSSTRCLLACLKHCGIWERNLYIFYVYCMRQQSTVRVCEYSKFSNHESNSVPIRSSNRIVTIRKCEYFWDISKRQLRPRKHKIGAKIR